MIIETVGGITKLTAAEGKLLSDGAGTIGRVIWLGAGRAASDFSEVDAAAEGIPDTVQRIANLEQVVDGVLEVLA